MLVQCTSFSSIYKSFSSIYKSFLLLITQFLVIANTAFTKIKKMIYKYKKMIYKYKKMILDTINCDRILNTNKSFTFCTITIFTNTNKCFIVLKSKIAMTS